MYLHFLFLYYLKCWKIMRYIKFGKWKIIPTGFLFNSYSLWESLTLHTNLKCRLIFRKTVLIPSYLPNCSLLQTHWLLIHRVKFTTSFWQVGWGPYTLWWPELISGCVLRGLYAVWGLEIGLAACKARFLTPVLSSNSSDLLLKGRAHQIR